VAKGKPEISDNVEHFTKKI